MDSFFCIETEISVFSFIIIYILYIDLISLICHNFLIEMDILETIFFFKYLQSGMGRATEPQLFLPSLLYNIYIYI